MSSAQAAAKFKISVQTFQSGASSGDSPANSLSKLFAKGRRANVKSAAQGIQGQPAKSSLPCLQSGGKLGTAMAHPRNDVCSHGNGPDCPHCQAEFCKDQIVTASLDRTCSHGNGPDCKDCQMLPSTAFVVSKKVRRQQALALSLARMKSMATTRADMSGSSVSGKTAAVKDAPSCGLLKACVEDDDTKWIIEPLTCRLGVKNHNIRSAPLTLSDVQRARHKSNRALLTTPWREWFLSRHAFWREIRLAGRMERGAHSKTCKDRDSCHTIRVLKNAAQAVCNAGGQDPLNAALTQSHVKRGAQQNVCHSPKKPKLTFTTEAKPTASATELWRRLVENDESNNSSDSDFTDEPPPRPRTSNWSKQLLQDGSATASTIAHICKSSCPTQSGLSNMEVCTARVEQQLPMASSKDDQMTPSNAMKPVDGPPLFSAQPHGELTGDTDKSGCSDPSAGVLVEENGLLSTTTDVFPSGTSFHPPGTDENPVAGVPMKQTGLPSTTTDIFPSGTSFHLPGPDESTVNGLGWLLLFLQSSALDSDAFNSEDAAASCFSVSLGTIHAAKGLEWDFVIIVGAENEILPHVHSTDCDENGLSLAQNDGFHDDWSDDNEERNGQAFGDAVRWKDNRHHKRRIPQEPPYKSVAIARDNEHDAEERRLLYVAMTRAKQGLWLTRVRERQMFGDSRKHAVSPFLRALLHKKAPHRDCVKQVVHRPTRTGADGSAWQQTKRSLNGSIVTGFALASSFRDDAVTNVAHDDNDNATGRLSLVAAARVRVVQQQQQLMLMRTIRAESKWDKFADRRQESGVTRSSGTLHTSAASPRDAAGPMQSGHEPVTMNHGTAQPHVPRPTAGRGLQPFQRRLPQSSLGGLRRRRAKATSSLMSSVASKPFRRPRSFGK